MLICKKLKLFLFLFLQLLAFTFSTKSNATKKNLHSVTTSSTSKELAPTDPLLLISTLDGTLHAVSKRTGAVKWKLDEDPVLNVPMESTTTIKGPTFLPDPHDGSLYAYDPSSEGLTKLPFTIPELVQASPCKSSDGILYTGRKQDVWYAINPTTGIKRRVITTESTSDKCPGGSVEDMFIGRTEYKITMYDTKLNVMRWNVTYTDYSSHANDKVAHSNVLHLASSADGFVITIDRESGQILWAQNYGYPVIAMYAWVPDGLQKVEMTSVAKETMTYLLKQADGKVSYWDKLFQGNPRFQPKEATLIPSLYVGQYQHGLYALRAMKHDGVQFNAYRNVHMLPGPNGPSSNRDHVRTQLEVPSPVTPVWKLLGYHRIPPFSKLNLPKTSQEMILDNTPLIEHQLPPMPDMLPSPAVPPREIHYESQKVTPAPPTSSVDEESTGPVTSSDSESAQIHWNEITIVAVLTSIITGLLFLILMKKQNLSSASVSPKQYDALVRVGQISFDPIDIVGRGSAGTMVYRGDFDGRKVAVKRVVRDCFSLADREVALLRESDEHQHVIRYHCMERDAQFQYIALELCSNTLQEYVENRQYRSSTGLATQTVLHQAMKGLDHLHRLKIVHRDVKPSNILISEPGRLGAQRVVISDFGLCKKLNPGRISVSLKSGTAGTDGWIAPEMIMNKRDRITQAVDIFSMGCVFYYVICGKHPFGDPISRQARIVAADYSLNELKGYEYTEEAIDLIKGMLQTEPTLRPDTDTILSHALFWDSTKTLQFFEDVSDRVEKESADSHTMQQLERDPLDDISNGVARDWIKHLCRPLQEDLHKFRAYKADSVRDLLRAIRNKKHHYRELPEEVKHSLGSVPDDFLRYFTNRFPRLLVHTYRSMACCRRERMFQPYYGKNAPNHLFDVVEDKDATIFTNLAADKILKKVTKTNHFDDSLPPVENTSPKVSRPVKVKSPADQDLDWRSSRPSAQTGQPSNAFKSLYKNTPLRTPSNYSALKPNRLSDEFNHIDRRESSGAPVLPSSDNGGADNRPTPGRRLQRFSNGSPRVSECSSIGSDVETRSRGSNPGRGSIPSNRSSKETLAPDVNASSEKIPLHEINADPISCSNPYSELPLDDTLDDKEEPIEVDNPADPEDLKGLDENGDSDGVIDASPDALDDGFDELSRDSNKKSKKPRRRRFKRKMKTSPLIETSGDLLCVEDDVS